MDRTNDVPKGLSAEEADAFRGVEEAGKRCKDCDECPGFIRAKWPHPETDCGNCGHVWQRHK